MHTHARTQTPTGVRLRTIIIVTAVMCPCSKRVRLCRKKKLARTRRRYYKPGK